MDEFFFQVIPVVRTAGDAACAMITDFRIAEDLSTALPRQRAGTPGTAEIAAEGIHNRAYTPAVRSGKSAYFPDITSVRHVVLPLRGHARSGV